MEIGSNDRIVEINGMRLIVHQNYCTSRRNIACRSKKFEKIVSNYTNSFDATDTFNKYYYELKELDDIEIIKVDGFY